MLFCAQLLPYISKRLKSSYKHVPELFSNEKFPPKISPSKMAFSTKLFEKTKNCLPKTADVLLVFLFGSVKLVCHLKITFAGAAHSVLSSLQLSFRKPSSFAKLLNSSSWTKLIVCSTIGSRTSLFANTFLKPRLCVRKLIVD